MKKAKKAEKMRKKNDLHKKITFKAVSMGPLFETRLCIDINTL